MKEIRESINDFITYWEREAEDFRDRDMTDKESVYILNCFKIIESHLISSSVRSSGPLSSDERYRLDFTGEKLSASLAIARSNYRSKHKTLTERLIDNIGGILNFLLSFLRQIIK